MGNVENNAKNDPKTKIAKSGGSIIDITDTPDVAVWDKEVRRRGGTDKVKEPSKIQSITTKSTTDEKMVDPANEQEVAASMTDRDVPLTDEADISKKDTQG